MPLQLGHRVQCGFLTAKERIECMSLETNALATNSLSLATLQLNSLEVDTLGSVLHPVHTIHRASTDVFQNDLRFIEEKSRETRAAIRTDGHLAICQDLDLFDGTNLETATKRWSVGVSARGDFVVRDEVTGRAALTLFQEGGMDLDSETQLDTGIVFVTTQAFESYRVSVELAQNSLVSQVQDFIDSGGGGGTSSEVQAKVLQLEELTVRAKIENIADKLRIAQQAQVLRWDGTVIKMLPLADLFSGFVSHELENQLTELETQLVALQNTKLIRLEGGAFRLGSYLPASTETTDDNVIDRVTALEHLIARIDTQPVMRFDALANEVNAGVIETDPFNTLELQLSVAIANNPGVPGEKGETGSTGSTGEQGPQGVPGEKGETGESISQSTLQNYALQSSLDGVILEMIRFNEVRFVAKEEINLELNNRSFVTQTELNDILSRLAHLESFY